MRKNKLTRRDFLKVAGVTSAGLALSACGVDVTKLPDLTATPSLTPFPTVTNAPTLTPTPMPPTISDLARKIGMDVGVEANYLGLFSPHKNAIKFSDAPDGYVKALSNFSILTNGYESEPYWTDYKPEIAFSFWKDFSEFAHLNNIKLNINHMFDGYGFFNDENSPVRPLLNAPKDEIENWMKKRLKNFFEIPYFTHLNFVNEVLYSNDETSEFDWASDYNPFYRIWGKEWVHVAYMKVYEEAITTGRKAGEDIRLIYNSGSNEFDSPRAKYEYDFLSKLKEQLQKETGVEKPFDIGMQFHVRTSSLAENTCGGPPASKLEKTTLTEHLKKFGKIGDIHISELTIATPDKTQEIEILHTIVESAIESKVCKSLIMWSPFIPSDVPWADCTMRHLYEGDFHNPKPSYMLDELYKILQSYAA